MNALIKAIQIAKSQWKWLLVLFGLGGSYTVLETLGITPGAEAIKAKIEQVAAQVVSPTVVN
jgi:hypothetical protein